MRGSASPSPSLPTPYYPSASSTSSPFSSSSSPPPTTTTTTATTTNHLLHLPLMSSTNINSNYSTQHSPHPHLPTSSSPASPSQSSRPSIRLVSSTLPPSFNVDKYLFSNILSSSNAELISALNILRSSPTGNKRNSTDNKKLSSFLSTVHPFNSLSPSILSSLAPLCSYHKFIPYAYICVRGPCERLWILLNGKVGTQRRKTRAQRIQDIYGKVRKGEETEDNAENEISHMLEDASDSDEDNSNNSNNNNNNNKYNKIPHSHSSSNNNNNNNNNQNICSREANFMDPTLYRLMDYYNPGDSFGLEAYEAVHSSLSSTSTHLSMSSSSHFINSSQLKYNIAAATECELLSIDVYDYAQITSQHTISSLRERYLFLSSLSLFSSYYTPQAIWRIAQIMKEKSFERGEIIIKQGEMSDKFYLIVKGECGIIYKTQGEREDSSLSPSPSPSHLLQLGTLNKGDYYGELGIITNSTRSCSVYSTTFIECLYITKEEFNFHFNREMIDYMRERGNKIYRDVNKVGEEWKEVEQWDKYKKSIVNEIIKEKELYSHK